MRKHYIDNLRWSIILLLIPFHAAQAFKTWTEPNYIEFGPNKMISSIIVFFGPFVMQLLFLFAGMSMRYALKKRSYAAFVVERIKRLLVPLVFGVLVLVPPMTYMADRFHNGYDGSLIEHYGKFFTVFTDLSGADGGFSFGQFWFLLYLFILSFALLGVIVLLKKKRSTISTNREIPFWVVIILGLPLPIFSELLSVGGKSFVEFFYFLLIGYYVFTKKSVLEKVKKYGFIFLVIGIVACGAKVYLFVFADMNIPVIYSVITNIGKWFMILGLIGIGGTSFNQNNKVTQYLTHISYPFFSFHFLFVVLFQSVFANVFQGNTVLLYAVPVVLSYAATIICSQIALAVPVLRLFLGCSIRR